MNEILNIFFFAAALGLQYFLSSRNSAYWGAIIPVLFTASLTWMLVNDRIHSTLAYVLVPLGLLLLLEQWSRGRKEQRKNRQRELDKMRTHDL